MQDSITVLASVYQEKCDVVSGAEAFLKDAKKDREDAKQRLIQAMLTQEMDSIGHRGRRYTIQSKTKYSKMAGAEQELFAALRADGLENLIVETVNAKTLDAAMHQAAESNGGELPEEYADCVHVYEYMDVSNTKA